MCYATPLFWIGLMLIVVFSLKLDWLPTSGMETVAAFHEGWARVTDIARAGGGDAVAINLLGEGLNDTLNPHLRNR